MLKKIFSLYFLIIISTLLFSNVYLPEYRLQGFPKIKNNKIDVYKIQPGLSMYGKNSLFQNKFRFDTAEEIYLDENKVKLIFHTNNITDLYPPIYLSLNRYLNNSFHAYYRTYLKSIMLELLREKDRESSQGIIPEIEIKLPKMALPKAVKSIMGKSGTAGRLNLNGSQRLEFSGGVTDRSKLEVGQKNNKNFRMEMKQDLNLDLRGTIGDKIHLNVSHRSSSGDDILPTPDQIDISYEGYEDEIIKKIEGGNISLSLGSTGYIKAPTLSEGLFGIRSEMEVGDLKLKTFIAKDEAQKNSAKFTGSSQVDSSNVACKDFVNRTHYYITDPEDIYELYTDADIIGYGLPSGWANNAIKTADDGSWFLSEQGASLLPKVGTVKVYLDDGNANNDLETVEGVALNENVTETFHFEELIEGIDFYVHEEIGIIEIFRSIPKIYTVGITYTQADGTVIGNNQSVPRQVKLLRKKNQSFDDAASINYWNYQVRNIYSLGMQNIKKDGFSLNVFNVNIDATINYDIDESSFIDVGNLPADPTVTFNDYLRLDTNNSGTVDGDDSTIDLNSGYVIFPFIKPFRALGDTIIYEEDPENISPDEFQMYFGVRGNIGREQISLGQMGILPGSVVIKMGTSKQVLKEKIDYIVDYDFGMITFLNPDAKDPAVELDIDYQYRPLFTFDSKSLMGIRADIDFNENFKLGGTFIYQSERVTEDKPKIGNENRLIILSNLESRLHFDAPFLTKAIDWLPFIKTDTESNINLSGEVAVSFPKIFGSSKQSDKNEAYIDDMESILDSYPLGVSWTTWSSASKPFNINFGKAGINWYNPENIYARDVYDPASLTEEEEKEKVTVLTCKIDPPGLGNPGFDNKYWAGIMRYVGNEVDFSEKKYIEFLVKVDEQYTSDVTVHVDLGMINEDSYRPGINDKPDTEDGYGSDNNIQNGELDVGEDVGLDRVPDGEDGDDPFDNYDIEIDSEGDYPNINKTEGNNKLDTEDLDEDGLLGLEDVYFEYSTSISDTSTHYLQSQYNGWKLYRIPLYGADNFQIVTNQPKKPDLEKISYARIWFEVEEETRIRLVNLDVVGNKWEESPIKAAENDSIISQYELETSGESMLAGIIDNQKDPHYTPAPGTVIEKHGEIGLEQSLKLSYTNLQEGHYGLVTQDVHPPGDYNKGVNLLGYDGIRFWVYSEKAQSFSGQGDYDLIIRLAADSLIYYEIRCPQEALEYQTVMDESGWRSVEISFPQLTFIKSKQGISDSIHTDGNLSYYKSGQYILGMRVGNDANQIPTLSNIKQISLGIEANNLFTGNIYFDDIRVVNPYEDVGAAAKTSFHTSFADFATFDANMEWRTPNFQTSTSRTSAGNISAKKRSTSLSMTNKYYLDKFFPAEWGLSIPVTLQRNQSLSTPLYKTSSDILRENLSSEEKERETNRSLSYGINTSFSQNKTPRSKILAYTIKNTSLTNLYMNRSKTQNAASADTLFKYGGTYNYRLNFPKDKVGITLWKNYKFFFFPNDFDNKITYKAEFPKNWDWEASNDTLSYWKRVSNKSDIRSITTFSRISYNLFSDISTSYELSTSRNLLLENRWKKINLGQEKDRTQRIDLNFDPNYYNDLFAFNSSCNIDYNENRALINNQDEEETGDKFQFDGGVSRNITGNLTFKFGFLYNTVLNLFLSDDNQPEQEDSPEPDQNENGENPEGDNNIPGNDPGNIDDSEPGNNDPDSNVLNQNENNQSDQTTEPGVLDDEDALPDSSAVQDSLKAGQDIPAPPKKRKTGPGLITRFLRYLGRLENFSIDYKNAYSTSYDKRETRPEFLYQIGAPHILPPEDINSKNVNDNYSVSSGFPILQTLSTDFFYSKSITRNFSQSGRKDIETTFPDITVSLMDFEKIIGLKILTSSQLSSSFSLTKGSSGDLEGKIIQSEDERFSFSPFLSWTGNWVHDIRTTLSTSFARSNDYTYSSGNDIIKTNDNISADASASWSFSAPQGFKLPFLKKRFHIKNTTTIDLDIHFDNSQSQTTTIKTEETIEEITKNVMKLTIGPGVSYEFNKNITGGLSSDYEYNNEKKQGYTTKIFNLRLWIEIDF